MLVVELSDLSSELLHAVVMNKVAAVRVASTGANFLFISILLDRIDRGRRSRGTG